MASMSRTEASLKSFYIFNSTLGSNEENEDKKILFYHPQNTSIDIKVKDIGFTEAIIQFTNSFTKDESCQSIHTQKSVHLYFQPEKHFWMVMTLNVPFELKRKDTGVEYNEYKGDELLDSTYSSVLKQAYNMFKLFMGTFDMHMKKDTNGVQNLINKLEFFFSKYILTMKLQNTNAVDVCYSIQYLPLDELLFLRIYNFINMIESTFPSVKHSVFLHNQQVVWSGIDLKDLYSVNEFLVGTLFQKSLAKELQGGSIKKSSNLNSSHYGNYITGPEDTDENCRKIPKMYITCDGELKKYIVIVYKALSGILCLFVEETEEQLTEEFFQDIHTFIGPKLTTISSLISENVINKTTAKDTDIDMDQTINLKYLYLSDLNFQHKGTLHVHNAKSCKLPKDVMQLITDLTVDRKIDYSDHEVIVKTLNDFWIVKRCSNSRVFVVILNKSSTLLEVSELAKKLYDQHLQQVYFSEI